MLQVFIGVLIVSQTIVCYAVNLSLNVTFPALILIAIATFLGVRKTVANELKYQLNK